MEPGGHRHLRVAPLGEQRRVGVGGVQPGAQLAPQPARLDPARVVLDEGVRHVDAEPARPRPQPVRHHVAQRRPVGARPLGVDGLAPGLGGSCRANPKFSAGWQSKKFG